MAQEHTPEQPLTPPLDDPPGPVLVTGAAGNIGRYFVEHYHHRYALTLVDADQSALSELEAYGRCESASLDDLDRLKQLFRHIDTVVHLAADPRPTATWDSVQRNNITGTYHVFAAAKHAGVRRVIFASSIHAVSGYPPDVQVKPNEPVNPGDLYGVSKCFGEALGRYMAEQEGVETICIRIGAFQPHDAARDPQRGVKLMDAWVSQRDLTHLIRCCIDDRELKFAIFHGLSDNRFKRMDISNARQLVGYDPQDDATDVNEQLKALNLDRVSRNAAGPDQSGLRNEVET